MTFTCADCVSSYSNCCGLWTKMFDTPELQLTLLIIMSNIFSFFFPPLSYLGQDNFGEDSLTCSAFVFSSVRTRRWKWTYVNLHADLHECEFFNLILRKECRAMAFENSCNRSSYFQKFHWVGILNFKLCKVCKGIMWIYST